jgi:endonuclease/exonuclease/phosphatase family metal-dependent hydrolase
VPEVAVASFNVHWGRGPRMFGFPPFDVVDACARLQADVLVLAESFGLDGAAPQHERVAEALGYQVAAAEPMGRVRLSPHPKVVARGGDPAGGGDGTWYLALLSRLPVHSCRVDHLPQLWVDPVTRPLVVAQLDAGGSPLTVCGAHLPHLEFGAPLITPWLRRALPPTAAPAVTAGDMNMWGWVIGAMTHRAWRRAVRGRTFPAHRPLFGIDHILVTPQVEIVSGEVARVGGSDHLPVRALLRTPG